MLKKEKKGLMVKQHEYQNTTVSGRSKAGYRSNRCDRCFSGDECGSIFDGRRCR